MNVLPSCAYYLRRVLKRTCDSQNILDLVRTEKASNYDLAERLHFLYPNNYSYEKVVLYLEQLIYSHQHAQSQRDQVALEDITSQILWWLGYGITIHPANAKVFVVDDTIETLKLVTTLLSKAGYSTDSALNGQLALAKIPSLEPDLILLDVNLPDIDGYQVYQKLQESSDTANIPVIFLSGVDTINLQPQQCQNRVGYLAKPFKPHNLLKCVNRYLKAYSPGDTLTDDMLVNELKNRQQYAQRLIGLSDSYLAEDIAFHPQDGKATYFFRATLDGRYLRVSQAFAQLCGYDSTEDMISKVTNLWEQIYEHRAHQEQWTLCLQFPDKGRILSAKIKTQQNNVLDVVEQICLIQDSYNRPLFYQGYIRLAPSPPRSGT
ncbi:response regulator [Leptothoe spongobia]|nr:response regulator [Leptothoe spongobia]